MSLTLDEKTKLCFELADDKKALNIITLDVRGICSIADHFLICSATSTTHVQAIADDIIMKLKHKGEQNNAIEGYTNARWILIDFFDLVVHVFHEESREFYDLERLWGHAPKIKY